MKDLVRAPALLSLLLSIPLWFILDNFIVALIVALLIAFLIAMCHSLLVLKRQSPDERDGPEHQDTRHRDEP
ncbi:hypothetical protein [Paracandidimonas soli]|uniref:hypothetical protein n=1 Tax=Paracandidimonas soli TaxID=1917182 RepID=UPI003342C0E1